ncbi:hypothetical protein QBC37DRAFT_429370 [Rhypophila decipiens]|uniref:Ysc84 actin-binding domain-containing protein n=1 Tax=Rhypophila decipiens TaxID=261697 RepID=A0AAN7B4U4_9PEZI|nr:hypothetical protein QBC37DRAFT_429370 [Rhypophila decipiens]
MTSQSARNPIPALGGFNPDYYAETASIAENISSSRPSMPSSSQQQSSSQSYPAPQRPHSSSGAYQQRPPQQQHAPQESGYGPTLTVPSQQYYAPPSRPSSSSGYGGGSYNDGDTIPPPNPPRPSSWSGSGPRPSSSSSPNNNNSGNGNPSSSSSIKNSLSERLHKWGVKAGVPINKLTNALGSEAFWPSTMDQECDKAARILQSFCKDGFYKTNSMSIPTSSSKSKSKSSSSPAPSKALVKIPTSVIASAQGLAIFTTFRTGLHISGAGGSGVVVSRLPSGKWSPPSGFLVHTLGAGLMVGLDIYDCVCVLRTREAVRAFMRPGRLSLGGELALAAGPIGLGTSVEAAVGADTKPVWSYMKSRGFYAGLQADGTVVIARPDANAAFYGARLTPEQVLRGDVPSPSKKGDRNPRMWPEGSRGLMEVLRLAEGRKDIDEAVVRSIRSGPTPGDLGRGLDRDVDSEDEYGHERRRETEKERERRRRKERKEDEDYEYEPSRRERSSRRSEPRERSQRRERY